MFHFSISNEGAICCLAPEGRLDTQNSSSFNEKLQELSDLEDYLIIDFTRCNYLSSTGIRTLISAAKKLGAKGGSLALSCLSKEVFQVLEMAGLHTVFHVFNDTGTAIEEILRLKKKTSQGAEIIIGDHHLQFDQLEDKSHSAFIWHNQDIVGCNELPFSLGIGSPAESLVEDEENQGIFATIGNCSGFIPFDKALSPEFRVLKDPSAGGIFLSGALSFCSKPESRVKLISPSGIQFGALYDAILQIPQKVKGEKLTAALVVDVNDTSPSITIGGMITQEELELLDATTPEQLSSYLKTTGDGNQIFAIQFVVNQLPEMLPDESVLDFVNRALTIENIDEVACPQLSVALSNPVTWLFYSGDWIDAASHRIKIETFEDFAFEPYKRYLTRRLYSDSAKVVVKQLHGGYSAQTFQVDSFDHHGRRLRPTVLKIANRAIISREAERCQKFSLPYIMNNSAMVLGTAFFCDTGALRYNFVGIGGEQSQLKWLTHYFHSWPTEDLEPLYDKIFLQILKPWYGQPVKEEIYPYRDQDPTVTFFHTLCETAEELLSIPTDDKYMLIAETGQKRINPYWFLTHEYQSRRDEAIDYYTSICHGDLNMQNILLDKDMNVYLIDFSETKPRSVVSDFARLEAIFMIEHAPVENEDDLKEMIGFTTGFYDTMRLTDLPDISWMGKSPLIMKRNLTLTLKMRKYAINCTSGDKNIVPYYLALLEWILPIVCYSGVSLPHKKLSAYVGGLLCEKILACDGLPKPI